MFNLDKKKEKQTMLIALNKEWEHSCHDDSDWYQVCYNSETNTIDRIQTYTTRFSSNPATKPICTDQKILSLAKDSLARIIGNQIVKEWKIPNMLDLRAGDLVIVRKGTKVGTRETCNKCNGTGRWINPKNSYDCRKCFACNGKGCSKHPGSKISINVDNDLTVISSGYDKDKAGKTVPWVVVKVDSGEIVKLSSVERIIPDNALDTATRYARTVIEDMEDPFYPAFRTTNLDKSMLGYYRISPREVFKSER